jgi:hypothetical protein
MSQAGALSAVGGGTVPTSFDTDSGTAIPVTNVLDIVGGDSNADSAEGIQTTGATNVVTVELTNRVTASGSTAGAASDDILVASFDASPFSGTAGIYNFNVQVACFDSGNSVGACYHLYGGIRTNGTTPVLLGSDFDGFVHEDSAISAASVMADITGNDLVLDVQGVAGFNLEWEVLATYMRSV